MKRADAGPAPNRHATDEELFALALPPAGEPEALPAHVLRCVACGRALQEWKSAIHDLKREEVDALARRSPEEWRAVEDATMESLRRIRSRRAVPAWAAAAAAALLAAALLLTAKKSPEAETPARAVAAAPIGADEQAGELAPSDRDDDTLLREVATLARADDADAEWGDLAAEPPVTAAEESL